MNWIVTDNLMYLAGPKTPADERIGIQCLLAGAVHQALEEMNRPYRQRNCRLLLDEFTAVADTTLLEGDRGALEPHAQATRRLRGILRELQ